MEAEVVVTGVAGMVGGAFLGATVVLSLVVKPLEAKLRAALESINDLGWLMGQARDEYDRQVAVLDAVASARGFEAALEKVARFGVEAQLAGSRIAHAVTLGNVRLVLEAYGREVAAREEAESALARERVVSAGLERWVSFDPEAAA